MITEMEGAVIVEEGEPEVLYRLKFVKIKTEPCLKCGNQVVEGTKICPRCGFDIFASRIY